MLVKKGDCLDKKWRVTGSIKLLKLAVFVKNFVEFTCGDTAQVLCTCIVFVIVLYLYCTCIVIVFYLYCTCIVSVLSFNRAVTVHNYRYPRVAGKKDNISSLAVMNNDTLDIAATAHLRF